MSERTLLQDFRLCRSISCGTDSIADSLHGNADCGMVEKLTRFHDRVEVAEFFCMIKDELERLTRHVDQMERAFLRMGGSTQRAGEHLNHIG